MSTGNSQKKALQPGQFRTQQGSPFNHVVNTGCSIDLPFPTFYVVRYLRILSSSVLETFIRLKILYNQYIHHLPRRSRYREWAGFLGP